MPNEVITNSTVSVASQTLNNQLNLSDIIQVVIAFITLCAVLVALFKERFWRNKDKPIIDVYFSDKDTECYQRTDMHVTLNNGTVIAIPTYYIRMIVSNIGKDTLNNAEVVLEKVEPQSEMFMSLNLDWAGFIPLNLNDITRTVRIPQGQSRVVNVIEVMRPDKAMKLSKMMKSIKSVDYQRYEGYIKGFRACSIKPNSLSDIFTAGEYVFHLGIYADNTEPKYVKLSIKYSGKWGKRDGKDMQTKYLKVKLLE